jgi:hypothetical protein
MAMHMPHEGISVAVSLNVGNLDPVPLSRRLAFEVWSTLRIAPASATPPPVDSTALGADLDIDAHLDTAAGSLRVSSVAHVTNTTAMAVDRLALGLAPLGLRRATLGSVAVAGSPVVPLVRGQTILVPLQPPLQPGAGVDVAVAYDAPFAAEPHGAEWLFARADGIFTAHRWIPWLTRERRFTRVNAGETSMTPVAGSVAVTLTSDVPVTVATGGFPTMPAATHHEFSADGLRDVGFAASARYHEASRTVHGVLLRVFTTSAGESATVLDEAATMLGRSSRVSVPHPTGPSRWPHRGRWRRGVTGPRLAAAHDRSPGDASRHRSSAGTPVVPLARRVRPGRRSVRG